MTFTEFLDSCNPNNLKNIDTDTPIDEIFETKTFKDLVTSCYTPEVKLDVIALLAIGIALQRTYEFRKQEQSICDIVQ